MCHKSCLEFGRIVLKKDDIAGKSIIEIGSFDINGSLRQIIEPLKPITYVGVDIAPGPGVDVVCNAEQLLNIFEFNSFDTLVSTEVLEHVKDWKRVVSNFKHLVRPNGILLITTRSKGCGFHGCPEDHWRYELSDMGEIFSDFIIEELWKDPMVEGVFLKARKPSNFRECETSHVKLHSIMKNRRTLNNRGLEIFFFKVRLFFRILRKKPTYLKLLLSKNIYEIATQVNHPNQIDNP